jgi:hypothetical protein
VGLPGKKDLPLNRSTWNLKILMLQLQRNNIIFSIFQVFSIIWEVFRIFQGPQKFEKILVGLAWAVEGEPFQWLSTVDPAFGS